MKSHSQRVTASTMSAVIGKRGVFHYASLSFGIEIHDVRQNFGRTDYFVEPLDGKGEQWVSSDSVTID